MGAKGKQPPKAAAVAAPAESPWRRFVTWSGIADPEADARLDEESAEGSAARGPAWLPVALLFALYGLAVLIYILLGRGQALPQVAPDEYQYSALARSVADGNGLTYNGGPISGGLRAALYIYAIAPAWIVTDSLTQSYAIAKAMGAFMICAVVFPTWLLARRYMPPLVALVPAALMLAGSWMTSSSQLIMENLALPLAAASLAALVGAISRPGSRWLWVVLPLRGARRLVQGAAARPHPDHPARPRRRHRRAGPGGWRERLRPSRWLLGLTAAVTVIGGIVILAKPSVLGSYAGLQSQSDLGRALPLVGRQSLAFIAMSAILPFILALAITARRRAWDEQRLRPLLIVFWVTTVVLVVVTGSLTTAFESVDWSIQRYVEYSLPVLYVLVVAGIWQGLIAARLVALVDGPRRGVAAADAADPEHPGAARQLRDHPPRRPGVRAVPGARDGAHRGRSSAGSCSSSCAAAAPRRVGLLHGRRPPQRQRLRRAEPGRLGLAASSSRRSGARASPTISRGSTRPPTSRPGPPGDVLQLLPHAADRDLQPPRSRAPTSRRAQRLGGAPVNGFTCDWVIGPDGTLSFGPRLRPPPTAFFLNDDIAKPTFYRQRVVAEKPGIGRGRRGRRHSPV